MISRASIVRWFLENRWAVRLMQRAIKDPLNTTGDEAAVNDPTLEAVAHQLVEMAEELHQRLLRDPTVLDAAPIIGGASRMQQLLEDLLSAAPSREPVVHGLTM